MVAAEVAARPAADMADIGDMPGMEDMLIAVWATAACPEYIETGIPKLDESPDMPGMEAP